MQITTEALVLKVTDIGDNDRLITLYSSEYGVISAFASGAKKLKNKYHAGTSFLCYSSFILENVKDSYRVRDASLIRCYFKLGCDIVNISLQQYFCDVVSFLSATGEGDKEILKLIIKSCHYINENKMNFNLIKAVFELRILSLSGYMPDLSCCSNCKIFDVNKLYFDMQGGVLLCDSCKALTANAVFLGATILSAMRHIVYSDFDKIFSFIIPDESAVRLTKITEMYLTIQTEYSFRTLEFYKSII